MKKFFTLPAAFEIVGCAPVEVDVMSFNMRYDNPAPDSGHAAIRAHLNPER